MSEVEQDAMDLARAMRNVTRRNETLFRAVAAATTETQMAKKYGPGSQEEYALTVRCELDVMDPEERKCRMKLLLAGEPKMNDWRRFRMTPEDRAQVTAAFSESGALPFLFDHGWTGRGTLLAGKILELPDDTPDIDIVCQLTPTGWQEAVVEQAWMSRSAGFIGWMDEEEFIHPVKLREGSFTSLPAMSGLGDLEPMAAFSLRLRDRFSRSSIVVPELTTINASASPAKARDRKEATLKLSPEALKRLDLAENASEDEINQRITELGAKTTDPPDVSAIVREQVRTAAAEMSADAQLELRRARLLDAAELKGQISPEQRKRYETRPEFKGADFLAEQLDQLAPNRFPTGKPAYERKAADKAGAALNGGEFRADLRAQCEESTRIYQYARRNGISHDEAKRALAAQGA